MAFTPVTLSSLGQSAYPAGDHQGAMQPWPAGATNVVARGLLSTADVADNTKACGIAVLVSFDNNVTVQKGAYVPGWQGGQFLHDGVTPKYPTAGTGWSTSPPTHVGAMLSVSSALSVGGVLDFS